MITHSIDIKRIKLSKWLWRNSRLNDPLRNNRFQLKKKVKVFYCIIEWKNWVINICIFLLLPNCQLSPPVTLHCKTSLIELLPSLCHICPSPQLLNKHGQVFAISNSWSVPINTETKTNVHIEQNTCQHFMRQA